MNQKDARINICLLITDASILNLNVHSYKRQKLSDLIKSRLENPNKFTCFFTNLLRHEKRERERERERHKEREREREREGERERERLR